MSADSHCVWAGVHPVLSFVVHLDSRSRSLSGASGGSYATLGVESVDASDCGLRARGVEFQPRDVGSGVGGGDRLGLLELCVTKTNDVELGSGVVDKEVLADGVGILRDGSKGSLLGNSTRSVEEVGRGTDRGWNCSCVGASIILSLQNGGPS